MQTSKGKSGNVANILNVATIIFWDFDGVIKDSVEVKTLAYVNLFQPFGAEVADRVKHHHEANGGMSRFDKIPLYLSWAGEPATPFQVDDYCVRFSQSVLQSVINSYWVPGVHEYLLVNCKRQKFVLVTATPQEEIEQILIALDLAHCFYEVHGAPLKKSDAIKGVLTRLKCESSRTLMIGDAETDLAAANANLVPFLLRRTNLNLQLQASYNGLMFDQLNNE